ncbi:MAG: S1/P1 nuclease [Pyrinomonadaceae bacterium]
MMKRVAANLTILTAMLAFTAMPALGWDDVGHKITAHIAWLRMTPTVRNRVIEILRQAPEDSHLAVFYRPYGIEPEDVRRLDFFMIAATWPDIVRDFGSDPRFRNEVRNRKYHKGNWHYDDTFWKQVNGKAEPLSGFQEGGVAVAKLNEFDKLIRDASARDADKAVAIAWIMHLIGDLHQPLHTSARVTDEEPKGDQGGNLFLLTAKGTPRDKQVNLHWYWDSIVGRNVAYDGGPSERKYIEGLAMKFIKRHPFPSLQARLSVGDFDYLQKETFALNPTDVFSADLIRFSEPSKKYRQRAFAVAERQLTLAGYRMGELFNAAFTAPQVVQSAAAPCQIIRTIMYPVFKKQTRENQAKAKPTAVLLDVCPTGPAARPTLMVAVNGKSEARAFDVIKAFASEDEARAYAAANSIQDVDLKLQ